MRTDRVRIVSGAEFWAGMMTMRTTRVGGWNDTMPVAFSVICVPPLRRTSS